MKRRERKALEAQLCALGNDMPQIDLARIKQMHPVTPEVVTKKRGGIARRLVPAMCALCCALLLVGAPIGMFTYDAANTTTLYIETTETAMLTVGANGKVKEITYDGAETVAVAAVVAPTTMLSAAPTTETLKGMQVEEAVDLVIAHMAENGSMESGCEVVISTVCRSQSRGDKMAERAKAAVLANQKAVEAATTVVVEQNITARETNKEHRHSPAREKYLAQVMGEYTDYTEEELKNFSTGFLRFLCAQLAEEDAQPETETHHPLSDQARAYYERYKEKFENDRRQEHPEKPPVGEAVPPPDDDDFYGNHEGEDMFRDEDDDERDLQPPPRA